ncbi:hypothetical protein [Lactiplantibacillus herbarum]|uniref:hypothetical protein n=1 Tax=Lactiplantibacillus herbarum TaxID=1670446 RepID=UPI00064FAD26|nr:hypothetical protein [Lactiplantibacillus herbarum]
MRVRVKDMPVRYKDQRYKKDAELTITQDAFNDGLFVCLDTKDDDQVDNEHKETTDEE